MKGFKLFHKNKGKRLLAAALSAVMLIGGLQAVPAQAAEAEGMPTPGTVTTVADPETLHRPIDIYGQNTLNAGKITVGKSVSATGFTNDTLDGVSMGGLTPDTNNFLVTLSQSAQVMGLSSKLPVPIDAVFVLDTSGSMADPDNDPRYENMISAANDAIEALMAANDENRIAVVAFSSENYGQGTSDGEAANILSELAHYDGEAATAHLQRVDEEGDADTDGVYVAGRKADTITVTVGSGWNEREVDKSVNSFRKAQEGGTNIQAGIALGASLLMDSTKSTTAVVNGETVTRMPFIIVLSDGNPTFSATAANWYDADSVADAGEQGPGSAPYAGNGFLAAMVAAYYKSAITERYFGDNASEDNHCNIYTIGVDLTSDMDASETALAKITLNPAEEYKSTNSWYNTFNSYWRSYTAGNNFNINVGQQQYNDRREQWEYVDAYFRITANSITNSKNYVNGISSNGVSMFVGGLGYNDDYFETKGDATSLNNTFKELVRLIQIKAISLPTDTSVSADFGGYVHFYDPIGEYMEVKGVHGIVADGHFFRGASFAQNMVNYGTENADPAFDAAITAALNGRLELSDSGALTAATIKSIAEQAEAADGQLYYNSSTDYNNSFCWWSKSYTDDNGDEHMQFLGFAEGDSIEAIEAAREAGEIPADAEYVCRSYYYYGTAGGEIEPIDDFLLLAVRVQRSLTVPYQETVYASIPGSLLSVDRVLITEDKTQNPVTYESFVQAENPIRIVYEVGLQSDINAQNVAQVLADTDYVAEKTADKSQGSVDNYDAATDTYYFYTNDWDRTKSVAEHTRALAHAGFDVADDNDFYTFTEDKLLYTDSNGTTPATTVTPGTTYYYARTYYDWAGETAKDTAGTLFECTPKVEYIAVVAPDADAIAAATGTTASGQYYVKAGTYTASSLTAENDDTLKVDANNNSTNYTGTSTVIAHPMRTNDLSDSHYTVFLGNNGRLALTADKIKTVDITPNDGSNATLVDGDGELITVGDVLTYRVKVVNSEGAVADAVVTDKVPYGTELVEGSIDNGGVYDAATGVITWNLKNIPVDGTVYVSFQVKVTEAALDQNVITVDNTATIQIGDTPAYTTNTVKNPPHGKKVTGIGVDITEGVKVGDVLSYDINYFNDESEAVTITITDVIPEGTTYVNGSATHNGSYDSNNDKLTWTLMGVQPNTGGYVSFRVVVDESARTEIENDAVIKIGDREYEVVSEPVTVLSNELELTKTVTGTGADTNLEFELVLTSRNAGETTQAYDIINGDYAATYTIGGNTTNETVTFTEGVAKLPIKHGGTWTIKGLPAGLMLSVTETAKSGYTPTFNPEIVTITSGTAAVEANIVNTYAATPFTFQLTGTKKLDIETHEYFADAAFEFEVYRYTGADWSGEKEFATGANATVSSTTKEAVFSFAPRSFTINDVGTHYYEIVEKASNIDGVTDDIRVYYMTLEVVNDGEGAINVISSIYSDKGTTLIAKTGDADNTNDITDASVTFTNEYDTASIHLTATKTLKNHTLTAGQFAFEVLEGTTVVARGQSDANGNITFTPITYTTAGTHTYTVKEVNGGMSDITYDTTSYTVTVEVEEVNGKLETTITGADNITFTNYYVPDSTSVPLSGTKVLDNRSGDDSLNLKAGQFAFEVLDSAEKVVATGHNDANGNISFNPIPIVAEAGRDYENGVTYTYTVKEVVPTGGARDPYMNYDTTEITIKVIVTVDKATGQLVATLDASNPEVKFENIQYPSSVTIQPEGLSKATKDTAGDTAALNTRFSFAIVTADANEELVTTGIGQANGDIEFGTITLTAPGTYQYWVKESNQGGSTDSAIIYDSTRYLLKVVVEEDMTASYSYYAYNGSGDTTDPASYGQTPVAPHYTNTYNAKTEVDITAKKVMVDVNGTPLDMGDWRFAFVLQASDASGILLDGGTEVDGISDADGNITFATLYYNDADLDSTSSKDFYYVMSEVRPANALSGVTYDQNKYLVKVKVAGDSNGMTAEVVSITKMSDNSEVSLTEGVTFTNIYQAVTGTSATITASKELTGRELAEDDKFIFNLYYWNGTEEILVDSTTNDADGNISFTREYLPSAVVFEQGQNTRTYTYVIREEAGNLGGVTYNPTGDAYWITVTITNDTTNAKLVIADGGIKYFANFADIAAGKAIASMDNVKFTNSYTPQGTSYTPEGLEKVLTNRPMLDDEFAFEVRTADQDALVASGLSKADGSVVFTPIALNEKGEFNYVITETHGTSAGVNYNPAGTKYYLKIVVTDNGAGNLVVSEAKYYVDENFSSEASELTFTNTYTVDRITVPVQATKTLTGRELEDYEFDFVLLDKPKSDPTATVVARADNVASADAAKPDDVVFTLNYEQKDIPAGETKNFTYYMSEVEPLAGHAGGVVTDTAEYKVVVSVENKTSTGTLVPTVTYFDKDGNVTTEVPAFTNTYTTTPATVSVNAYKELNGKSLEANEFEFVLAESNDKGATGTVISNPKNNDAGVVELFKDKEFDAAGTYYYKVIESSDNPTELKDAGGNVIGKYTYDTAEYIIKVEVEDDLQGVLHATTTYYKAPYDASSTANTQVTGIGFTNSYDAEELVTDLTGDADIYIGATKSVTDLNGNEVKITENGQIVVYSPAGFEFKVTDVSGNPVIGADGNAVTGMSQPDGTIKFSQFKFENSGEYRYWISENTSNKGGITDDGRQWEVHITVSYANTDTRDTKTNELYEAGTLYVDKGTGVKTYLSTRSSEMSDPQFINIYNPAPVSLIVTANKELSGRTLKAGEFTFRLMEGDIIRAETHNTAEGEVVFNFTEAVAGEHTYTIVEVIPLDKAAGVIYDEATVGTVKVTVVDDGTGQLKIDGEATVTKDSGVTFKNTYKAEGPAIATITAKKVLENSHLEADAFTFELVNDSNPNMIIKAKNDADGNVQFATLSFNAVGKYTFTIREVKGSDDRITYDENSYKVTVEVIDNLAGQLYSVVSYDTEDGTAPVFVNTYNEPDPTPTPTPDPTPTPAPEPGVEYKEYTFTKVWNDNNDAAGKRPDSIIVKAYQNGVFVTDIVLNEANGWTNKAILMARNGDIEYEWTIKEENVPEGYFATYNQDTLTVTNTYGNGSGTLTDTPSTGDNSNIALYAMLALTSIFAIVGLVVLKKKEEER